MAEMREILFRGFYECENGKEKIFINGKKITGVWVYGGTWKNARGQRFITEDNGCKTFAVIPETVGQYTGRTAECAVKIFEGNRCIVTTFDWEGIDYQHECKVEWVDGCLAFSNDENEFWLPVAYVEDTEADVEVIGNIHDNPELLTTK